MDKKDHSKANPTVYKSALCGKKIDEQTNSKASEQKGPDNTAALKAQALEALDQSMQKQIKMGKIIVFTIGIISFISSLVLIFLHGFTFAVLTAVIIQAVFSCALISGVSWIRYLFAVSAFLNIIPSLKAVLEFINQPYPLALTLFILLTLYQTACGILLIFNKSVSEYIDRKSVV